MSRTIEEEVLPLHDLPSGTVTFLFTDIEGSTRLLQQLRDRYATALGDHLRILRAAIETSGGQDVDTQVLSSPLCLLA